MKNMKKIISLLLVIVMAVGVLALTGCSGKKDPAELFINAFNTYNDAIKKHDLYKIATEALKGGSLTVGLETTAEDEELKVNGTLYFDETGKAISLKADAAMGENQFDAAFLLNNEKLVIGSSLLGNAYGIDISKAKENFPTSLFGTKGLNMMGLTEEDEQEILKAFDELNAAFNKEQKDVDLYALYTEALKKHADFTLEEKATYKINEEDVKSNIVTAALTKADIKAIMNDIVTGADLQDTLKDLLDTYNESAKAEAEMWGETAITYASLNDIVDEMLEGKNEEDVVLTIKLALDTKHDAIMAMELNADKSKLQIILGKDVKKLSNIKFIMTDNEEVSELNITIKDEPARYAIEMLDKELNGLTIVVDRAHKECTMTPVTKGEPDTDNAVTFGYELSADALKLTFDIEGDKMTLTLKAKDESPIKYTDYKDLLTMSEEDMNKLMEELEPYLQDLMPEEPDYPQYPDFDEDMDMGEDGTESDTDDSAESTEEPTL